MSQETEDGLDFLQSCSVVLIGAGPSPDHLLTVFRFLSCQVHHLGEPAELSSVLSDKPDKPVLGIFLASDFSDKQMQEVARTAAAQSPKLPLFLFADKPQLSHRPEGGDVLGSLVVPTTFDVLINLVHKAKVFIDSQSAGLGRSLDSFRSLTGKSSASREIDQMIQQVANSSATVLILGESGTGKEVTARKLHMHSNRRNRPFVPVNCGAIPEDLLESELFGHEKGAFTGAITARKGRFEMAEGGTLFLDEIGDMSMPMQVKILRVLQERTFERIGSNQTIECDVRILAATHRDLEQRITEGLFREDLYFRLNVFPIEIPPLRERSEDIPLLVQTLIRRMEQEKRGSVRLTAMAISALRYYNWPGNVRELANFIERMAILFPQRVVDVADLPEKYRESAPLDDLKPVESRLMMADTATASVPASVPAAAEAVQLPAEGMDLKAHLVEMEKQLIQQALDEADGVVAQAAKKLKMRRTTLVEKLRKYDMQRDRDASLI